MRKYGPLPWNRLHLRVRQYSLGWVGLFWIVLDCFGLFRIVLDCFGLFWCLCFRIGVAFVAVFFHSTQRSDTTLAPYEV